MARVTNPPTTTPLEQRARTAVAESRERSATLARSILNEVLDVVPGDGLSVVDKYDSAPDVKNVVVSDGLITLMVVLRETEVDSAETEGTSEIFLVRGKVGEWTQVSSSLLSLADLGLALEGVRR